MTQHPMPRRLLLEALQQKKCLIASHRGCWGGHVVQNTIQAYALALRQGADILETDVMPSADGEWFCFHDGSEERVFGLRMDLLEKTGEEIRALKMVNAYGQQVSAHVPTLEETLAFALERGAFLNIDRAWDWFDGICPVLDRYPGAAERVILKAPVRKGRKAMAFLSAHPVKYMFMPLCYSRAEWEEALGIPGLNTVGAELIAFSPEGELYGREAMDRVHRDGGFVWVNTLCLGEREKDHLYGELDDTRSLRDPAAGWGQLMEMGADVLQTDWPNLVREERARRFAAR